MEAQSRLLLKLKPSLRRKPVIDYTARWSRLVERRPRFNRMDPDPDSESEATPPATRPPTRKDGKIKLVLTKQDWEKFWAERLRKLVDAPHLTDKDICGAVERSRRIFFRNREESRKIIVDPDIPHCYYWSKFEVAQWLETAGFAVPVKKMFLHFGIAGRHLITVDANKLLQMGLYELGTIRTVTKAIRDLLGLPHTNGLRPVARVPPLESFLKLKVPNDPYTNHLTFKEFCEQQRLEYEPVKQQMAEGYPPMQGCCYVEIKPDPNTKIKWIPVPAQKRRQMPPSPAGSSSAYEFQPSSSTSSRSSSDDSLLHDIPTVEELARNALLRNTFIPKILNDIVEAVYVKVAENKKVLQEYIKQAAVNEVVTDHLDRAYSDFHITDPEDKLKFLTIIAEELVEDVLRAREILEDIEGFQRKIKTEIPAKDMVDLQQAIAYYVQNIMPTVVVAARTLMEDSSSSLHSVGNSNERGEGTGAGRESPQETEDFTTRQNSRGNGDDEMTVIWDRNRFIEEPDD